jgi:transcriptional regulator with XRE-family HTH domain
MAARGLSLAEVGRRSDVSNRTLAHFLRGRIKKPRPGTVEAWARALGVRYAELVDDPFLDRYGHSPSESGARGYVSPPSREPNPEVADDRMDTPVNGQLILAALQKMTLAMREAQVEHSAERGRILEELKWQSSLMHRVIAALESKTRDESNPHFRREDPRRA